MSERMEAAWAINCACMERLGKWMGIAKVLAAERWFLRWGWWAFPAAG